MNDKLTCPACGAAMLVAPVAYRSFACTACGGVWAGYEAAERIDAAVESDLVELADFAERRASSGETPEDGRKCPECGIGLVRQTKAKTQIDVCKFHGTWFDKGELQRVSQGLQAGRERAAKKKEKQEKQAAAQAEKSAKSSGGGFDVSALEGVAAAAELVVGILSAFG